MNEWVKYGPNEYVLYTRTGWLSLLKIKNEWVMYSPPSSSYRTIPSELWGDVPAMQRYAETVYRLEQSSCQDPE